MVLAILFALLAVHATGTSAESVPGYQDKTILTFNTALTLLVPEYESRRGQIAEAVAAVDADVVCLQELFYEEDVINILDELKNKYPFSWSFLHSTVSTSREVSESKHPGDSEVSPYPCDAEEFIAFGQCLQTKCSSVGGGLPLLICVLINCQAEAFALPSVCLSCLAFSAVSLDSAFSKCATPGPGHRFQPEALLVLSKRRISDEKRVQFFPNVTQLYPRGLLDVNVDGIGKVLCTHLTANVTADGIPFAEIKLFETYGITSWGQRHTVEIQTIKNLYDQGDLILAGDLNCGPAVPSQNVVGEIPDNYDALIVDGFVNPYVDMMGPCTYCVANPFVDYPYSIIIDHILLRGYTSVQSSRMIDDLSSQVSDHYGVLVTITQFSG